LRTQRVLLAVAATAALLLTTAPGVAGSAAAVGAPVRDRAAAPAPGAPGAGDEYFPGYGNGGYDVAHYDLRLRYTPRTDLLEGTATLLGRTTAELSRFNLDFVHTPTSVRVNGFPATFTRAGTELTVTPARPLAAGAALTVVVQYAGIPSSVLVDGWSAWSRTPDGGMAVGEPEAAAWWYPSNDHPTDKATFDISVAVPAGTEVLSNGVLTRALTERGWTRWSWRTTKPTATYLAFVVIGQYEINNDTAPNGQPVVTAYSEGLGENLGAAKASLERTAEVVEFLSGQFGPYPFEAQGGVAVSSGVGFALENQTRPVYGPGFFRRGSNTSVVVHEQAHQWFGDSVSVAKWRNIWLNEGFATYAEWLWSEAQGEGTAQELFDWEYSTRPADDPFWQVPPGDPGAANLFHSAVYDRGAMTVHALRTAVGDPVFFDILKTWQARKKFGNGTNEEFIALAERKAGKQLDALFTAWLYTKGKPQVGASTGVAASAARARLAPPKSLAKIRLTHQHVHPQVHRDGR
jgi:aminopeptidase N